MKSISLFEKKPFVYGVILFIIWIISSIHLVISGIPHVMVSFCYLGLLVVSLGFLLNRPALVYSYVSVAIIAQIPFSIDLLRLYLGLDQIMGLVTYNPDYLTNLGKIVDFIVHIIALPLALFGLSSIKIPKIKSFVKWHVILVILFCILSFFTGRNCIIVGCFENLPGGSTTFGNIGYLLFVSLIGPLIMGLLLIKLKQYLRLRKKNK